MSDGNEDMSASEGEMATPIKTKRTARQTSPKPAVPEKKSKKEHEKVTPRKSPHRASVDSANYAYEEDLDNIEEEYVGEEKQEESDSSGSDWANTATKKKKLSPKKVKGRGRPKKTKEEGGQKGRGRPKKTDAKPANPKSTNIVYYRDEFIDFYDDSEESDEEISDEEWGPHGPRWKHHHIVETKKNENDMNWTPTNRGMKQKKKFPFSSYIPTGKPRGRPKTKSEAAVNTEKKGSSKGRGRPKKDKMAEEDGVLAGDEGDGSMERLAQRLATPTSTGRGRPKKTISYHEEDADGAEAIDEVGDTSTERLSVKKPGPAGKGRGRPKKSAKYSEPDEAEEEEEETKKEVAAPVKTSGKGRGRPKKAVVEDQPDGAIEQVKSTRKGRGRPKKEGKSKGRPKKVKGDEKVEEEEEDGGEEEDAAEVNGDKSSDEDKHENEEDDV